MGKLGIGVIINALSGGKGVDIREFIGKTIIKIDMNEKRLRLLFFDETSLTFRDNGQSCCENRYMRTDDDLEYHVSSTFLGAETSASEEMIVDEYGEHEIEFLKISTSNGGFTISNHNEHNGYYGGFWIIAEANT